MTPTNQEIMMQVPSLMAERLILLAQIAALRNERDRLRAALAGRRSNRPAGKKPFDWRLVLENLDFNWPEDIVEAAKAMRDAENRLAARQ